MQVGCRPQHSPAGRIVSVLALHPQPRERIALHSDGLAVQKQLHRVAVGVAGDGDELSFPTLPVPVWEQVQHRLIGPLALVEVEAVLAEAARVDDPGGGALRGPARLAQVIDAGPHEVAGHVVVGSDELPQLLGVDVPAPVDPAGAGCGFAGEQRAIVAPDAAHRPAFRANHASLRKRLPVDAVILLDAVAPAVHVVIADHVEEGQKLGPGAVRRRLRVNAVAARRHQPRGVFSVKNRQQFAQRVRAVGVGLVADFVARAPQHDRGMVAVAMDEVGHVPLVPFVEVVAVPVGADLCFRHLPLVEGLVHDQESHAVAQVQKLLRVGIVAGAYGVTAHLSQQFEAPLPDPLGHRRPHAAGVVVQAHAVQLHLLAVQQEALVGVENRFADADGRIVLVHYPVLQAHRAADFVQVRVLH